MKVKTGKQITIEKSKNLNTVLGTVDNKSAKSIYINISSWLTPILSSDVNYNQVIKDLNKVIRKNIYDNIDTTLFHQNRTIVDLDIKESGIKYGKSSYMGCEITVFQKMNLKIDNKRLHKSINNIVNVINDIFDESIYFSLNKKKN